jgi:transcriptional regulator with XRE-family HTH domain
MDTEDFTTRIKNLGMFLRELRKQYQVTITEASADMGIARNTLSCAERSVTG